MKTVIGYKPKTTEVALVWVLESGYYHRLNIPAGVMTETIMKHPDIKNFWECYGDTWYHGMNNAYKDNPDALFEVIEKVVMQHDFKSRAVTGEKVISQIEPQPNPRKPELYYEVTELIKTMKMADTKVGSLLAVKRPIAKEIRLKEFFRPEGFKNELKSLSNMLPDLLKGFE